MKLLDLITEMRSSLTLNDLYSGLNRVNDLGGRLAEIEKHWDKAGPDILARWQTIYNQIGPGPYRVYRGTRDQYDSTRSDVHWSLNPTVARDYAGPAGHVRSITINADQIDWPATAIRAFFYWKSEQELTLLKFVSESNEMKFPNGFQPVSGDPNYYVYQSSLADVELWADFVTRSCRIDSFSSHRPGGGRATLQLFRQYFNTIAVNDPGTDENSLGFWTKMKAENLVDDLIQESADPDVWAKNLRKKHDRVVVKKLGDALVAYDGDGKNKKKLGQFDLNQLLESHWGNNPAGKFLSEYVAWEKKSGIADKINVNFEKRDNDRVYIDIVEVYPEYRKRGLGTRIMNAITEIADRNNVTLTLSPTPQDEDTIPDLSSWYMGFGFDWDKFGLIRYPE